MKRSLALAGVALAILGFYGPWVTTARWVAALTYNALDLTEFCKFIVRAGIASVTRELFLIPIVAAALALALWTNRPEQKSRVLGYALTFLAAVFSLVPLPPFTLQLAAYLSAEDRASFGLSVAGVLGVLIIFALGRRVAGRWRDVTFGALALIGALPAAWELFSRAMPAISAIYRSPAPAGWGFWVAMMGFALAAVSAVMRGA